MAQIGTMTGTAGAVTSLNLPYCPEYVIVGNTYSDTFGAWQFGQFDYIDSIKDLQNGSRKRFELRYDGELLFTAS